MARYACSDLHGRYDLAEKILATIGESDELYFLGDAIDRGHRSWDTLQLLLNDPRVTFMCGNHEDFLVKRHNGNPKMFVTIDRYQYTRREVAEVWSWNGGSEMIQKCNDLRERDPEALARLANRLALAPNEISLWDNDHFREILLTHAGYTPGERPFDPAHMIWNRDHLDDEWPKDEKYAHLYMVHGHTPIEYIYGSSSPENGPVFYADSHKIDIDVGAVFYGWACLFNCDTFTYTMIEGDHQYDI